MKTNISNPCPACAQHLTKSKATNMLVCKNKSCKKEYSVKEYNELSMQKREEEATNRELQRLIDDEQFILEAPSKTFQVGDIVNSTYGKDLKVIESHQDKFYLLEKESNRRWVRWHEIYLASTIQCPISFNKRSENIFKRVQFSNRRLDGVLHYYFGGKTNMNPAYQRGFVWTIEHKTKLIDAIFNGSDIGKIVIIRLPWQANSYLYEILDGKQRLSTIVEFVEDRFQYNGYYFSQLQDRDKSEFLSAIIAIGETDEGLTEEDKIKYFLSVNDTGVPQDPKLIESLKEKLNK